MLKSYWLRINPKDFPISNKDNTEIKQFFHRILLDWLNQHHLELVNKLEATASPGPTASLLYDAILDEQLLFVRMNEGHFPEFKTYLIAKFKLAEKEIFNSTLEKIEFIRNKKIPDPNDSKAMKVRDLLSLTPKTDNQFKLKDVVFANESILETDWLGNPFERIKKGGLYVILQDDGKDVFLYSDHTHSEFWVPRKLFSFYF